MTTLATRPVAASTGAIPQSIGHFIGGVPAHDGTRTRPIISPVDGSPIGTLTLADAAVVDETVQAAQRAFAAWSQVPVKERVQPLFRFKALAERHLAELAGLVSRENGKTPAPHAAPNPPSARLSESWNVADCVAIRDMPLVKT